MIYTAVLPQYSRSVPPLLLPESPQLLLTPGTSDQCKRVAGGGLRGGQTEAALRMADASRERRIRLAAERPPLAVQLSAGHESHTGIRIAPLRSVQADGFVAHEVAAAAALRHQLTRVESLHTLLTINALHV